MWRHLLLFTVVIGSATQAEANDLREVELASALVCSEHYQLTAYLDIWSRTETPPRYPVVGCEQLIAPFGFMALGEMIFSYIKEVSVEARQLEPYTIEGWSFDLYFIEEPPGWRGYTVKGSVRLE